MHLNKQGKDLYSFIQQDNIQITDVQLFLKQLYPEETVIQKEFNSSHKFTYLSILKKGISVSLKNSQIECFFLYGKHDKKYREFSETLPFGFMISKQLIKDIVGFLGEPDDKEGGDVINITIQYRRFGIDFTFLTKSWDFKTAGIDQITIYKAEINQNQKKCGICKGTSVTRCSQCKLVYYCSSQCQKIHWKTHKALCQNFK